MSIVKVMIDVVTPGRGFRKPKRHGEMYVHGTDSAIFPLTFKPTKFEVNFCDPTPAPPTCNPPPPDTCAGAVVPDPENHGAFGFQVSWSTSGSRRLHWMVEGKK